MALFRSVKWTLAITAGLSFAVAAAALTSSSHARGPTCTAQADPRPGFAALPLGANPACIRISLR